MYTLLLSLFPDKYTYIIIGLKCQILIIATTNLILDHATMLFCASNFVVGNNNVGYISFNMSEL